MASNTQRSHDPAATRVAYFSMEIAVDAQIPTYSGGLGVLAGDLLRSAADLEVPMCGVTLAHHKGYFRQKLDSQGNQSQEPDPWRPNERFESIEPGAPVQIEGCTVVLRAWRHWLQGISGYNVPVYFLDSALPENSSWDQTLTDELYGGDPHYRLCQEAVLGLGGAKLL